MQFPSNPPIQSYYYREPQEVLHQKQDEYSQPPLNYQEEIIAKHYRKIFPQLSADKIYALMHAGSAVTVFVDSAPTESCLNPAANEFVPAKKSKKSKKEIWVSKLNKTELCEKYSKGFCKFGETCNFAHGQAELKTRERPPSYKTISCTWPVGECPYKKRCKFKHIDDPDSGKP